MPRAVVFLGLPRVFMSPNQARFVVADRAARHNAHLHMIPHALPVGIEGWLIVLEQQVRIPEMPIRGRRLLVYLVGICIDPGKIDFGPDDMQKTVFVPFRQVCCFLPVHDVIGNGRHTRGIPGRWVNSAEWMNIEHGRGSVGGAEVYRAGNLGSLCALTTNEADPRLDGLHVPPWWTDAKVSDACSDTPGVRTAKGTLRGNGAAPAPETTDSSTGVPQPCLVSNEPPARPSPSSKF